MSSCGSIALSWVSTTHRTSLGPNFVYNGVMFIFEILGLVAIIYIWFGLSGLRERVDTLERSFGSRGLPVSAPVSPAGLPLDAAVLSVASPPEPPPSYLAPEAGSGWWERFTSWLKEDWLLKLGALLIIIGFGWFVTYAFLHNWIGPMGRITLGLVIGAFLLAFGWWRMMRYKEQGAIFLVLGATAILITVFAARYVYQFFTPLSAMGITFLASAFVGLASVKYRVHSLALCGLVLASVVPLLVESRGYDEVMRFYYLFLVTLGILWIVLLTGWRDLLVAALAVISIYSAPHWTTISPMRGFYDAPSVDTLTYIAFGFVVVFFLANIFAFLFAREGATRGDIVGAVWTGLFLVFWVFSGVEREWQSLMFAAWTVAFVVAAFVLYAKTGNRKPLITYAAVGVMLLGIATARELDGAALTIAFTLEAAVATFLSGRILHDRRMSLWTSALFIVPALLSFESIARYPRFGAAAQFWESASLPQTPIFHEHFFALFVLALAFFVLGFFFKRPEAEGRSTGGERVEPGQLYTVLGSLYAFVLLWLVLHELFLSDTATMLALVCYTIIGLGVYLPRRRNDLRAYRIYGGALLGFVVVRLLLVEVWNMELSGRIITFFLVGALLMSTAFIGRRKKLDVPTP